MIVVAIIFAASTACLAKGNPHKKPPSPPPPPPPVVNPPSSGPKIFSLNFGDIFLDNSPTWGIFHPGQQVRPTVTLAQEQTVVATVQQGLNEASANVVVIANYTGQLSAGLSYEQVYSGGPNTWTSVLYAPGTISGVSYIGAFSSGYVNHGYTFPATMGNIIDWGYSALHELWLALGGQEDIVNGNYVSGHYAGNFFYDAPGLTHPIWTTSQIAFIQSVTGIAPVNSIPAFEPAFIPEPSALGLAILLPLFIRKRRNRA